MLRIIYTTLGLFALITTIFSQTDHQLEDFKIDDGIPTELATALINFPDSTEIAIAIVQPNGEVIFHGCRRSNDRLESVNNQDALFQIGSVSKVITATSLAKMIIQGKVELEAPINPHFDFPFKDNIQITFKELATHSSGLPRLPSNMKYASYDDPYSAYDGELLETLLADEMQIYDKAYAYSNLGAGLLGYTLAKIRGSSYNDMVQQLVVRPLSMSNTGQFAHELHPTYQVPGRNYEGVITSDWNMNALAGAGALYSTANDLSRFIKAQFDATDEALTLSRQIALAVNEEISLALGWHILHHPERNDWWFHNGAVGGFVSSVTFDPKEKFGVVVLSNVSAFNPKMNEIDQLCFALMRKQLEP